MLYTKSGEPFELILDYKEFAVHLILEDLLKVALAVFGGMSGRKVNKFRIAREKYGVRVSKAKKIRALSLFYGGRLIG